MLSERSLLVINSDYEVYYLQKDQQWEETKVKVDFVFGIKITLHASSVAADLSPKFYYAYVHGVYQGELDIFGVLIQLLIIQLWRHRTLNNLLSSITRE